MAEYNRDQLVAALRKADAAGDEAAARAIAKRIKAMGTPQAPARTADDPSLWAGGKVPSVNPTDGVSSANLFAAGAGKSLRDTGLGAAQFALHGMAPYANAASAITGKPSFLGAAREYADERINANQEADAALTNTWSGFGGNATGLVAQMLAPAGALAGAARVPQLAGQAKNLSALSRLFMPSSIKAGAAQGAALGALQPVADGDSRALNAGIGAGGGALGGLLPRIAGAGLRGLNRLREPLTQSGLENIVGRTLQRFATNPQLQQFADPILGRAPTLAEATLDPGIAQLQRAATSKSPEVASAIFNAQATANGGRLAALQGFAGSPAARDAAMAGVKSAEDAAYAAIRPVTGADVRPVVQQIDDILAGPQGKRSAVVSALTEARKSLFMDADQAVPENAVDRIIGARLSINDLISGKGDNRAGQLAQAQLIQVREALDSAIRKVAPGIDAALDARRVGMQPINEMDAMQELLGRATADVSNPVTGGLSPAIRPAALMTQGGDLDRLAIAGTGFRKASGDGVFGPAAQDAIEGVRTGVARQRFADSAAKVPGSPTAQFLAGQNVMDGILGQPKGGFTSGLANLGAAALDKPYAFVGVPERLNTVMARVLTDPTEAQRILAQLPAPDRALIEQAIGRISAPAGSAAASGRSR